MPPTRMQALYLDPQSTPRVHLRTDLPVPMPVKIPDAAASRPEALVRVHLAGVCATDLALIDGYYPFRGVLGHEFVGHIAAAAEPRRIGERVVGEINVGCGQCADCRGGRPTQCGTRTTLGIRGRDGAFAEYLRLPLANLLPVPASVSDAAAVFVEPLAAALQVLEQRPVAPGERVLVVGAGRLGQLLARVLRLSGAELAVVARHPDQRRLLDLVGVPALAETAVATAAYDLVVEASGGPGGFALARRAVRRRGTLVLKSTYRDQLALDLSGLVVDEITLIGSRCGPFAPALRLLAQGLVDPTPLIRERFPLADGIAAVGAAQRPGAMKVLIDCGGARAAL